MVIMIDIDGTICTEEKPFERPLAKILPGAVETINKYVEDGHTVVFWTGRGWDQYKITKKWLDDHGFQYAQLLMGKPIVNLFIDDRARHFEGWDKDYLSIKKNAQD
jgi:hydroxymethylpyrimidine pyrophosphatase-like HAD family hydrolase